MASIKSIPHKISGNSMNSANAATTKIKQVFIGIQTEDKHTSTFPWMTVIRSCIEFDFMTSCACSAMSLASMAYTEKPNEILPQTNNTFK